MIWGSILIFKQLTATINHMVQCEGVKNPSERCGSTWSKLTGRGYFANITLGVNPTRIIVFVWNEEMKLKSDGGLFVHIMRKSPFDEMGGFDCN